MNQDMPEYETEDALLQLMHLSMLADDANYAQDHDNYILRGGPSSEVLSTLNIEDLSHWEQLQDQKHERFMLNE